MEQEDQTLKDALDTDPDLLDFNLDEDSLGETALADSSEDEIIELVDVIKKGKYDPDRYGDTREFRHLFDEDITPVKKPSAVDNGKIKWAKEFEEEESDFAPDEIHAATLEIREMDLIYDEEDHSSDDIIDITERDLMRVPGSEVLGDAIGRTDRGENLIDRDENIVELHEDDMEKDLSAVPEVPLEDLMELNVAEPAKTKADEEISEKDLEEVLEGASTDEISLDFQEETPKLPRSSTKVAKAEEELNLEDELEKALEEAAVEEEGVEEKAEQENLEESLQKLFEDEEDEEPLVKTVKSKTKPAAIPKEEKVKSTIAEKRKPEISKSEIEALITREVRAAVEKVARETMSSVAEKFIVEAITSLKKSLDSSSD
jgi:hypothetical protein